MIVWQGQLLLSKLTNLAVHSFHSGGLSHIADVHSNLEALVEGLGMEKQHDLSLKHPADGRIHLRTHHHHPLQLENSWSSLSFILIKIWETHTYNGMEKY